MPTTTKARRNPARRTATKVAPTPVRGKGWNNVLSGREYQITEIIKQLHAGVAAGPRFTDIADVATDVIGIGSSNVAALLSRLEGKGYVKKVEGADRHHTYELTLPRGVVVREYKGPMKATAGAPVIPGIKAVVAAPKAAVKNVTKAQAVNTSATDDNLVEELVRKLEAVTKENAQLKSQIKTQRQFPSINTDLLKRIKAVGVNTDKLQLARA